MGMLTAQLPRYADEARLTRAVCERNMRKVCAASAGSDVDYAAPSTLAHRRNQFAAEQKRRCQIDSHDALPEQGRNVLQLEGMASILGIDTRIVHEDVAPTKGFSGVGRQREYFLLNL